ncbi:hypothetical protein [Alicyclobacillus sendaiensis]|uniref:hypothetical protein n=1 Tax=Alicyclobacillus sendaiensis TaxID=192387 RepID=UPI0026F45AD1|nr:hypothetical protein [Alicyclobacillus sendaiensis]
MPEKVTLRGKVVGVVDGDVFTTRRKRAVHFMRAYNGYAVQEDVFRRLLNQGIRIIRVVETDTGTILQTSIDTFDEHGIRFDLGHGRQVALSERYWEVRPSGQLTLL